MSYVDYAHEKCRDSGECQLSAALRLLGEQQALNGKLITAYREKKMSGSEWCDLGGHAFSAKDPARKRLAVTSFDEHGQPTDTDTYEACGVHASSLPQQRKLNDLTDEAPEEFV